MVFQLDFGVGARLCVCCIERDVARTRARKGLAGVNLVPAQGVAAGMVAPERLPEIKHGKRHEYAASSDPSIVLSRATEYTALQNRLAGTAKQYSRNAMHALTVTTT